MAINNQAHQLEELMQSTKNKEAKNGVQNNRNDDELSPHVTKFIAITSGKGGVGKSTMSANLSYMLYRLGFRVVVFDADIGLANLDVMLGVKSNQNLLDALRGNCKLEDIIIPITPDGGLFLVPGESGAEILKYSGELMFERFIEEAEILDSLDFVIIDTGAGIGEHTQAFLEACDDVIVLTVPDPAALTDAYATIKVCSRTKKHIFMIMNMVKNQKEAQGIFEKIQKVANRNLEDLDLDFLGAISLDASVGKATKSRSLFVVQSPLSIPSTELETIARKLAQKMERKVLTKENGRFGRFFQKILRQF